MFERIRIYKLSEGISEPQLSVGIGVKDGMNSPGGIRVKTIYQTPLEAYDFSRR